MMVGLFMRTHNLEFVVTGSERGQTLAAVLKVRLHVSWSAAREIIDKGQVKIAGIRCSDPVRRLKPGQRVALATANRNKPKFAAKPAPESTPLPAIAIRYIDDHILVVEKPSGLTTMRHASEAAEFGARGRKFLPKTMADWLPQIAGDGLPIIAVHRVDRDTTGLVVFARNKQAEQVLGRQFRAHSIDRRYLALVRGRPKPGRIESMFVLDRGDGRRGSSPTDGQRAVTHVRIVEEFGPLTLVECRLETGRTHQVRIHLGELGTPICGETVYDRPLHGAPLPDPSRATRIYLHAAHLGLLHPVTGRELHWESPVPDDMAETIGRFRSNPGSTKSEHEHAQ
jgi:23S rRNA pseudouridine1911/1915/1917 synthase